MHDTPTLSDTQTLSKARSILEEHLPLEANGYTCRSRHLYDALLAACASGDSLEAVCRDLPGLPKAGTLRSYLNAQLTPEALPDLERRLNRALVRDLPGRLRRKAQRIALDFHDRPYYGKADGESAGCVRGRARDGTTRFLRLATAYVMHRGLRLTVAVRFVLPEHDVLDTVRALTSYVEGLGVPLSCLLLDKGFASIDVMRHLEAARLPAIVACPIRGKEAPEPGGTRALCQGRASYMTGYTFGNGRRRFTARLAVCRVFTTARRTGRMPRRGRWLLFVVIGEALGDLAPRAVRRLYAKRFGIETSYRLSGQVRAWTTSKNVAYRFVLWALSFLMVNVWVHLRWLFTQVPRRGGRWLDRGRFRLGRYARFVRQALERSYGFIGEIAAPAPPIP